MRQIHKDYKGWHQITVSYQTQDGVIGMRIPKLKTDLVLKWREQRNSIMSELQALKRQLMELPRTKQGRVYKRAEAQCESLRQRQEALRTEMHRIDGKYWTARKREQAMSHEPVFKLLFSLWSRYDSVRSA